MAYYIMIGDRKTAESLWPKFSIATFNDYGNASYPLADDPDRFLAEMEKTSNNPGKLVRIKWIDGNKNPVCSGLYLNYVEYLYLIKTFSPNRFRGRVTARQLAKSFLHDADPRLLSPVVRNLVIRLTFRLDDKR